MARRGLFLAGVDARSRADDDSAGPVHLPESGARSLAVARHRRRRDLSRDDARDAPDVSECARMGGASGSSGPALFTRHSTSACLSTWTWKAAVSRRDGFWVGTIGR